MNAGLEYAKSIVVITSEYACAIVAHYSGLNPYEYPMLRMPWRCDVTAQPLQSQAHLRCLGPIQPPILRSFSNPVIDSHRFHSSCDVFKRLFILTSLIHFHRAKINGVHTSVALGNVPSRQQGLTTSEFGLPLTLGGSDNIRSASSCAMSKGPFGDGPSNATPRFSAKR